MHSEGQMYTSWVNRNYKYTNDKREYAGSLLKAGEFHWNYDATLRHRSGGSFSWHWGTKFCHLDIELGGGDGNDELEISLGFPYILSIWFHHTLPSWIVSRLPQHHYKLPRYQQLSPFDLRPEVQYGELIGYDEGSYPESREISLRIDGWALWWVLWMNDNEWRSTDSRWRRGTFHFDDALLGRNGYLHEKLGEPVQGYVTVLEGDYPVVLQRERRTWWRHRWPWWPFRTVHEAWDVRCDVGIPFPGKGTMSYNCGEDGLYGTAFAVETPEEACERFRDCVVEYRKKYGGKRCAEEPWPQAPVDRLKEHEERLRQRRDEAPPAQAVMPA